MRSDVRLNVLGHFELIHPEPPFVISALPLFREQLRSEQSINLFDAPLMSTVLFHHLEQQRQIKAHAWNGRSSLGQQPLHHDHFGSPVQRCEFLIKRRRRAVQIFLSLADGSVIVDRPCHLAT